MRANIKLDIAHSSCPAPRPEQDVAWFKPTDSDTDGASYQCERCGTTVWLGIDKIEVDHRQAGPQGTPEEAFARAARAQWRREDAERRRKAEPPEDDIIETAIGVIRREQAHRKLKGLTR